ncbi:MULTISPECIES: DUF2680 domain-containing protein [unclassified Fusibacter]|uniref:DUF2680 domain-containing protein n=1 Tax=unclassified Fusibacter TaxID=2624464 RepID=UPI001012C5FB|nr:MULTISPECIES: DUF2680 domain-containing protein [unclassified Fusibacter]MCK8060899.1 YckD family protein [Fusibacter sp. A2]NPE23195.1 DUF2680 domain-containing protein [Fusibacter sp. A1]RXV59553.1 DUF2680 domain-containing protein [Fusibacter sp. A1]
MKKNIAIILTLVLAFGAIGIASFADTEEVPQWFNDMLKWRTERIGEAVESGDLTQEDAELWLEHMEEMEAYHEENGFTFSGGMYGLGKGMHGSGGPGMGMFGQRNGDFERPDGFTRGSHPCFNQDTQD